MGYSMMWVAARDLEPLALYRRLKLEPTGELEYLPESDYVGAQYGDWHVAITKTLAFDGLLGPNDETAQLSSGADMVVGAVDETVMCTFAARWSDGTCVWSIDYAPGKELSAERLVVEGDPPGLEETINRLRARYEEAEAEYDWVFEVPVAVAQAVTSFRYDEAPGEHEPAFAVLLPPPASARGLLGRARNYMQKRRKDRVRRFLDEYDGTPQE